MQTTKMQDANIFQIYLHKTSLEFITTEYLFQV